DVEHVLVVLVATCSILAKHVEHDLCPRRRQPTGTALPISRRLRAEGIGVWNVELPVEDRVPRRILVHAVVDDEAVRDEVVERSGDCDVVRLLAPGVVDPGDPGPRAHEPEGCGSTLIRMASHALRMIGPEAPEWFSTGHRVEERQLELEPVHVAMARRTQR